MQASETTSPRKQFNRKTINNQAINNAGGWSGRANFPTLKIRHCSGISSAFIMLERERMSGSRTGCQW